MFFDYPVFDDHEKNQINMKAIVAMDLNRVIGCNDKIPWHFSEDSKWFKEFTMGKPVVMGRKTYLSLGKIYLIGRKLIVLTKSLQSARFVEEKLDFDDHGYLRKKTGIFSYQWYVHNIEEAIDEGLCTRDEIIVAGGKSIYEKFLPEITEMYVTHIMEDYDGNTFMPPFEHLLPNMEIIKETKNFWIVKHFK